MIIDLIIQNIPVIIIHFILGFGPGMVLGIWLGNLHSPKSPLFLETHEENMRKAAEHNAQWHPEHERWKE